MPGTEPEPLTGPLLTFAMALKTMWIGIFIFLEEETKAQRSK